MLLCTVRQGNNASSWNNMLTWLEGRVTTSPSSTTRPLVGCSKPANTRNNVLFPQPLGPTIVTNSPRAISRQAAARRERGAGRGKSQRSSRSGSDSTAAVRLKEVRARSGTEIKMLGLDHSFRYQQDGDGLSIEIPGWFADPTNRPCKTAYCFKIAAAK